MTVYISSMQNDRVKTWKKLQTSKGRKKENTYLVETWHLIQEAQLAERLIECMLTQEAYDKYASQITVPISIISSDIANNLAQTITTTGVFGVVNSQFETTPITNGQWLLLDGVQDPGNMGTIIRTADAAGFSGVIIGEGCVDVFNDKTIRAMQGSQFHLKLYKGNLIRYIQQMKSLGIAVYGSELNDKATTIFEIPYTENVALVMGNEGNGISKEVLQTCTQSVYIPILGQAESLNVAVAASIMIYHFVKGKTYEN